VIASRTASRSNGRRLGIAAVLVTTLITVLAGACSDGDDSAATPLADDGVRIAAFDFTESVVLAELYAQTLEATGVPVVRLGSVGPREIAFPALELGVIDLVPEYLGTVLEHLGVATPNPDTDTALAELIALLEPLGLAALEAAPAEDENVIVLTAQTADDLAVRSISELRPHAGELRFGGPPECPDRPLCLVGLRETYGLTFAEFVAQRSQAFTAEALQRGEIDVAQMFSTDPALDTSVLVVLTDDRHLQPAENIVPVVRQDALDRWGPQVATALDEVSAALTTPELQAMNARVLEDEAVGIVVAEWLADRGLPSSTA
jgi:osmoprotectant transport system substrate-binding protein